VHAKSWLSLVVAVSALSILVGACSEPTPEEKVAMLRARYEAKMNGFFVEQRPVGEPAAFASAEAEEPPEGAGEDAGEDAGEEAGDEAGDETSAAEAMAQQPVALVQDVILDIEIRHESPEKLGGVTVDITMADGERELETWRAWFDTSELEKGPGFQYSHKLEDVDYQSGYGFSAEVRHPIPPGERAEYLEFSNLGD
jgi:hypothetical protein